MRKKLKASVVIQAIQNYQIFRALWCSSRSGVIAQVWEHLIGMPIKCLPTLPSDYHGCTNIRHLYKLWTGGV